MQDSELDRLLASVGGEKQVKYDLDRFKAALEAAGRPERDVQSVVVAGTNGKGTTTLLISAALKEAGHRTATYLSPHLQHPRERFLLDLEPASSEELDALAAEAAPLCRRFDLTYFETLTLLFFLWARKREARFLVLEVGLGGRLDAVNVTDPLAVALTNISWDHMDFLGDTLEKILEEKLACLRTESLLFTGIRDPKLLARVEARCLELDSCWYYSKEIHRSRSEIQWEGQTVTLNGRPFRLTNPSPGAAENAALAYLLLQIAFPAIPVPVLQRAFATVRNPGRLEVVSHSPRVVLSGDHNPAGLEDLETALKDLDTRGLRIVCGFSPDKPYDEMYAKLRRLSEDVTLTVAPRARGTYQEGYFRLGPFVESPEEAVRQALSRCSSSDTLLVTGSLYLTGAVRGLWKTDVAFT